MIKKAKAKLFKYYKWYIRNVAKCRNYILFESYPDFADSTIKIYEELIKRGYNKKYKFVWFNNQRDSKNKKYACINDMEEYQKVKYLYLSKLKICNNTLLYELKPKQKVIYISHGSPVKSIKNYYYMEGKITKHICQSPFFIDAISKELRIEPEKTIGLGYPRVDDVLSSKCNINSFFDFNGKIIIWCPTFKKSKWGINYGSGKLSDLLDSENDLLKIDNECKQRNILLVVKYHWASASLPFSSEAASNVMFVDEKYFEEKNTKFYSLLGKFDALLTDYSSIFYDYLVADKPIGFVFTDIEEYKINPGIVPQFLENTCKCGQHIYNMNDLINFLDDVNKGIDTKKSERERIKKLVYPFDNMLSTERVTDYIETLLKK